MTLASEDLMMDMMQSSALHLGKGLRPLQSQFLGFQRIPSFGRVWDKVPTCYIRSRFASVILSRFGVIMYLGYSSKIYE